MILAAAFFAIGIFIVTVAILTVLIQEFIQEYNSDD